MDYRILISRRVPTKLTSLETKQAKLDGKVSNVLDKTHANSQTLVDIKSMFLDFLRKLKDQSSPSLVEPKALCD
jgi:hypothetical protein